MNHPLFETGKTLTRYGSPQDCAYFLDFDGTLFEIAERPDAVAIERSLLDLLERLNAAASGAIAIISGRPIADIDRWFTPIRWPVAGQHGAERRSAHGTVYRHAAQHPALESLRAALRSGRFAIRGSSSKTRVCPSHSTFAITHSCRQR